MRRLTSSQLTAIVIAAMLCLAVPATTVAAGVAKVQISDGQGRTAKVKDGRVKVAAKLSGTVQTTSKGPVATRPAPLEAVHQFTSVGAALMCSELVAAPANRTLVIDQLRIDVYNIQVVPNAIYFMTFSTTPDCQKPDVASLTPTEVAHTVIPFEPGYRLGPGQKIYVRTGDQVAHVYVDGYLEP